MLIWLPGACHEVINSRNRSGYSVGDGGTVGGYTERDRAPQPVELVLDSVMRGCLVGSNSLVLCEARAIGPVRWSGRTQPSPWS